MATDLVALRQNGYGKINYLQGFRHGLATKNKMNCFIIRQYGESLKTLLTTLVLSCEICCCSTPSLRCVSPFISFIVETFPMMTFSEILSVLRIIQLHYCLGFLCTAVLRITTGMFELR
jgi:hypothetical protein